MNTRYEMVVFECSKCGYLFKDGTKYENVGLVEQFADHCPACNRRCMFKKMCADEELDEGFVI